MTQSDDSLKRQLIASDDAFRKLYEQHQALEKRLAGLQEQTLLSEEDELEEKQLKRQKLMLKDQMEMILRSHREAEVSA